MIKMSKKAGSSHAEYLAKEFKNITDNHKKTLQGEINWTKQFLQTLRESSANETSPSANSNDENNLRASNKL